MSAGRRPGLLRAPPSLRFSSPVSLPRPAGLSKQPHPSVQCRTVRCRSATPSGTASTPRRQSSSTECLLWSPHRSDRHWSSLGITERHRTPPGVTVPSTTPRRRLQSRPRQTVGDDWASAAVPAASERRDRAARDPGRPAGGGGGQSYVSHHTRTPTRRRCRHLAGSGPSGGRLYPAPAHLCNRRAELAASRRTHRAAPRQADRPHRSTGGGRGGVGWEGSRRRRGRRRHTQTSIPADDSGISGAPGRNRCCVRLVSQARVTRSPVKLHRMFAIGAGKIAESLRRPVPTLSRRDHRPLIRQDSDHAQKPTGRMNGLSNGVFPKHFGKTPALQPAT